MNLIILNNFHQKPILITQINKLSNQSLNYFVLAKYLYKTLKNKIFNISNYYLYLF